MGVEEGNSGRDSCDFWRYGITYQELAGHEDDNATVVHCRLGIEGSDLVLDLLKGQGLRKDLD
jgi:hypothetical protein